jgi:putative Mg2+ transporter-C (MgtC) family protein
MSPLTLSDISLRILVAFLTGLIIGWERESHGRPAGLRTTILTCVASALAMILSEVFFNESSAATANSSWRPDPARLAAGVLTGIGFLGAGTILRHENMIRGVTTAATLWFVTVLGLAFGSGQFTLGFMGVGIALVTLHFMPRFEKHIRSDSYATLSITTTLDAAGDPELRNRIETLGPTIKTMKLSYDLEKRQKTMICELKLEKAEVLEMSDIVVKDLSTCPGILHIVWL